MARINIPKSEYGVLRDLAELPDASFASLFNGLSEISPNVNKLDFSSALAPKLPTIDPLDLKAFLRTIFSLYRMLDVKGRTPQTLTKEVKETIDQERITNFPQEKSEKLRERLERLLSIAGGLTIIAKARSVIGDQDKAFCGVRILSDIRPVFTVDPNSISAASVVHFLNLHYHQDAEHKEFYVALSNLDLELLKKEIERAEKKAAAMKAVVERADIRYLEGE